MDVKKKLRELFEFQRFENDPALKSIINETDERYFSTELSENDLSKLSAAGDPYTQAADPRKREKKP